MSNIQHVNKTATVLGSIMNIRATGGGLTNKVEIFEREQILSE